MFDRNRYLSAGGLTARFELSHLIALSSNGRQSYFPILGSQSFFKGIQRFLQHTPDEHFFIARGQLVILGIIGIRR